MDTTVKINGFRYGQPNSDFSLFEGGYTWDDKPHSDAPSAYELALRMVFRDEKQERTYFILYMNEEIANAELSMAVSEVHRAIAAGEPVMIESNGSASTRRYSLAAGHVREVWPYSGEG
jgi:hypothetical protein